MSLSVKKKKTETEYVKECIMAWVDDKSDSDVSALDVCLGLMGTIEVVYTFDNAQKCFAFVSTLPQKRVLLVLGCQLNDAQWRLFLDLSQVERVYRFNTHNILKEDESKLVHIPTVQQLYSRLNRDANLHRNKSCNIEFAVLDSDAATKPLLGFEEDARIFIYYQFLIERILCLPSTPDMKQQFTSFCMENTNNNPTQQQILKEIINNYQSDQAISLYTRSCCLHHLVNRTLRMGNTKNMLRLAYFIADLYAQLRSLHAEYCDVYEKGVSIYRGRAMSKQEYENLKASIGCTVVTKSFLSTSIRRDVAEMYTGAGMLDSDSVPVILHIIIDKQGNRSKPFAFVGYHSSVRADEEILLSMGMVFRIVDEISKVN